MIKMKSLKVKASKNSPTLLAIAGIGLMLGAVARACFDTKRYLDEVENAKIDIAIEQSEGDDLDYEDLGKIKLDRKQHMIIIAKCYWETAALTALSIGCIVTSNRISIRRNAALAALYAASEAKRLDYMAKTKEIVGEKYDQEIRERISEDHINKNKVDRRLLDQIPVGDTLCYDNMFGRYFFSSTEKIQQAEKKLNERLFSEMYISLNDLYYELGMSKIGFGDEFGWNVNDGLIDLARTYVDNSEGVTCICIDYDVRPKHDFSRLG